jgi:hypothetical protein
LAFDLNLHELGVRDFIANLHALSGDPNKTAAEKLRAAIANHLSPLRTRPAADYIRVFIAHRHELPPGPRQTIAALGRTYQQLVEQLFVDGIASGQLRSNLPPQLAALAFLGLCNSVIANRSMPRSSTIDVIIKEYARIIIGGVAIDNAKPTKASRATRTRRTSARSPAKDN